MIRKLGLAIMIIAVCFMPVGIGKPSTAFAQVTRQALSLPGELAIYYGFPSLVNGSGGDLSAATEVFNDYDIVVFGDGLQDPGHPDHLNSAVIFSNLKTSPNNTAVYGYIPIGVTTVNLSMDEIWSRVDAWQAMGVAGIFLDEAGYGFGVPRQRQNDAVDYVHAAGLSVFINAFNPDHVFSPAAHPIYNPTGLPTHLGPGDYYLHESFQIILGEYQDPAFWASKSDRALAYQFEFGTRMATVTTVSPVAPGFDQAESDYAWWSTLLYGFDAMGWGELHYSAVDNILPYRARPVPGAMGSAFTSPVTHAPPVHTRTTTSGTIEVNTDTHAGSFTPASIQVTIDIKPGIFPNDIDLLSLDTIPVAILTSGAFDAGAVASTTVRFGRMGTEAAAVESGLEDVDADGDTDMLLQFNIQDTGILCGDTTSLLTGTTFSGRAIEGSDSINTLGCD